MNSITHATPAEDVESASDPGQIRGRVASTCSDCRSAFLDTSPVVVSSYEVPDLAMDLLAAIVVESAKKRTDTEAA